MNIPKKSKAFAIKDGRIQEVDEDEIDIELQQPQALFGSHINLIPIQSAVQGPRLFYGARFYNQAMPLEAPEAPLVQNLDSSDKAGRSFDEILGRQAGALFADDDMTIMDVKKDRLIGQTSAGETKEIPIYNSFVFNRKTMLNQTPLVKKGDIIKKGQLLAKSNYTDDSGTLAMGLNARVGVVPYKGYSMDDAFVVSESFAKRLKSDHTYTASQDFDRDTKGGLHHYVSLFPTTFTKTQLKKLDKNGIIMPGMAVEPGDPLILATRPRVFSSTGAQLGKLSKTMRQSRHDSSQIWEEEVPGIVTDVAKTKTGYKVVVNSKMSANIGDKITCYDDTTEFLTTNGWKNIKDAQPGDVCYTINDEGALVLSSVIQTQKFHYDGPMYSLETTQVSLFVTPDHNLYARPRNKQNYELIPAENLFGKTYRLQKNVNTNNLGYNPDFFIIEKEAVPGKGNYAKVLKIPIKPFCRFLGYYISDGNCFYNAKKKHYGVSITQCKRVAEMEQTLIECGFNYNYSTKNIKFNIGNKLLWEFLEPLGKAINKYIPDFVWSLPQDCLEELYQGLMTGDGTTIGSTHQYFTISDRLVGDIQRLCLLTGRSANLRDTRPPAYMIGPLNGKTYTTQPYHCITIYRHKNMPTINHSHVKKQKGQKEEWVPYSGTVYCVTLEDHNKIYTRRNGKTVWCGQCRSGQKGVISLIIPDERMPRTVDGQPLDVLLNPLSLPSRANNSLLYELALGKVAQKLGHPIKLPGFLPKGQKWLDVVKQYLADNGVSELEEVFDPAINKKLENPITVGIAHINKLHHTSSSKLSARSQGAYNADQQPLKGGSAAAQAKKLSGLETQTMLSAGAYKNLKEGSTLRGQKNDEYWRALRQGYQPRPPGTPFVWDKFQALLVGTGYHARKIGDGKLRLGPFTDDDLDALKPIEVKSGESVNLSTLDPIPGGLFDQAIVGNNKWGRIKLPRPVPNPAFELAIRQLLGLKEQELRDILEGKMELPEHLR